MSSVNNRLIIESYCSGGYGIFYNDKKEDMGLDEDDVKILVRGWLNNEEKRLLR